MIGKILKSRKIQVERIWDKDKEKRNKYIILIGKIFKKIERYKCRENEIRIKRRETKSRSNMLIATLMLMIRIMI